MRALACIAAEDYQLYALRLCVMLAIGHVGYWLVYSERVATNLPWEKLASDYMACWLLAFACLYTISSLLLWVVGGSADLWLILRVVACVP